MDESGFRLNYPLNKCWMKVHEQKALPANTQTRSGCLLAGVIDWQSAEVWAQPVQKLSSECLIGFFSWLFLEVFPNEKLVPEETQVEHFRSPNTLSSFLDSIAFPQRVYLERLTNQVNVVAATDRKEEANSPSLYFAEGTTLPTA